MTVMPFDSMTLIARDNVEVEVAHRPLPIRMRFHRLRPDAHRPRPHLPSFSAAAAGIPAVGVTAITTLLVRERRRAAG